MKCLYLVFLMMLGILDLIIHILPAPSEPAIKFAEFFIFFQTIDLFQASRKNFLISCYITVFTLLISTRPILSLLGWLEWSQPVWMHINQVDAEIYFATLLIIAHSIVGLRLGLLLPEFNFKSEFFNRMHPQYVWLRNCGWLLVFLGMPGVIAQFQISLQSLNAGNYAERFLGIGKQLSIVSKVARELFMVGGTLIIVCSQRSIHLLTGMALLLFGYFSIAVAGQRFTVAAPIVAFLCVFCGRRPITARIGLAAFFVAILVAIGSQILLELRSNLYESGPTIMNFLSQQGGTIVSIFSAVKYDEIIDGKAFDFLYRPITILLNNFIAENAGQLCLRGNSILCAESFTYSSHTLSYFLNNKMYLNGYGIGSSFLAETWLLAGKLGVTLFSFFTISVLKLVAATARYKCLNRILILCLVPKILWAIRGEVAAIPAGILLDRVTQIATIFLFISCVFPAKKNVSKFN